MTTAVPSERVTGNGGATGQRLRRRLAAGVVADQEVLGTRFREVSLTLSGNLPGEYTPIR